MMKKTILLVDDEINTLREVVNAFSNKFAVLTVDSLSLAKQALSKKNDDFYCTVIDLKLDRKSEFSGIELIKYLREEKPHTPYLIFSAYSPLDSARQAFKSSLGLDDVELEEFSTKHYISKAEGNYIKVLEQKLDEISRYKYDFGKFQGLLIAINSYDDPKLKNLKKPIDDAKRLRSVLDQHYEFQTELIENATRKDIIDALSKLHQKISEDTNVIIFFAGHGSWDEIHDHGYWLPQDAEKESYANWISHAELKIHLKALPAKHVLLIADACFAGSISRESGNKVRCEEVHKTPSKKALTSCDHQPTPDESVFLDALVNKLETNAELLPVESLHDQLKNIVMEKCSTGDRLHPRLVDLNGNQKGDFVFVPKTTSHS